MKLKYMKYVMCISTAIIGNEKILIKGKYYKVIEDYKNNHNTIIKVLCEENKKLCFTLERSVFFAPIIFDDIYKVLEMSDFF